MGAGADFNPGFSFDAGGLEAPAQAPWEFGGALRMALKDPRGQQASTIDDKISKQLQERQQSKHKHKHKHQQQQQQQPPKGKAAAPAASRKRPREQQQDDDSESDVDSEEPDSEQEPAADSSSDDEDEDELAGGSGGSSEEAADSDADDTDEAGELGSSDVDVDADEAEDDEDMDSEEQPLPGELDSEDDEEDDVMDDGEDESSDDDEPPSKSKQQQQQQKSAVAAAAAARKAAAAAAAAANGNGSSGSDSDGSSSDEGEEDDSEDDAAAAAGQKSRQRQQSQAANGSSKGQQATAAAAAGKKSQSGGKGGFYAETQRGIKQDERTFQDLNLSRPLLRAVAALGYTNPTPIQAACIPLALAGRDICGSAMTGSGKTAAFALPILERLLYRARQVAATYVLILSPTRELAAQIHSMTQKLAQFTDIDAALIVGGLSLQAQAAALRAGPAIVVATPGRIIDHVRNSQGFGLEDLAVLVLDEADRLLEMGFKEELRELLRLAPRNRQTMLFSATFNDDVQQLAALSLKSPVRLAADPTAAAPASLSQEIVRLKGAAAASKEAVLLALASRSFSGGKTIIFCKTKQTAHRLKILFGLCELPAAAELHGDMTQAARLQSLERFRQGEVAYLLATDVAARGLEILGVQVVLNFDAPRSLETYLHRIGRTARAGADGLAVSIMCDEDRLLLKSVVKQGKVQLKQRLVPQQAISRWQAQIEDVEPEVARVIAEEREEAALRRAEMEANKAQNLLEHENEIFSRPARTWFQTEKEKKAAAAAAAAAAAGRTVLEDAAAAGGQSKADKAAAKAAAKQDKRNAKLKERRAAEAAAGGKKKTPELQTETEQFNKAIKGVKSRARALMQQGMTAKAAQKMAQKAVTGVSTKHEKKKRKTSGTAAGAAGAASADASGGLFSGDGTGQASNSGGAAAGGKGRSGSGGGGGKSRGNVGKTELNKIKRGGKGKSSFKSKKKFKRRK